MSGKEEKPEGDIPVCPKCKEKPLFWILYPNMIQSGVDGWFWLHSDKYLEGETTRNKLSSEQSSMGRTTTLENIVCVVCRSKNPLLHTFTDEHPIFYEVLKQARRLNDEW